MKTLAVSMALALAGCSSHAEPPLLAGLPTDFNEGRAELERRAKAAFPIGTAEGTIEQKLVAQGFKLSPMSTDENGPWHDARFER